MFLCDIKDEGLFFPSSLLHINLFCFLSTNHMHFGPIFRLVLHQWRKNHACGELQGYWRDAYEQPKLLPHPSFVIGVTDKPLQSRQLACLDGSCPLSSPRIETQGPALAWRLSFSWQMKGCSAEEVVSNGIHQKPSENKVTLTLSEYHKNPPETLFFRSGLQTKRKADHTYPNLPHPPEDGLEDSMKGSQSLSPLPSSVPVIDCQCRQKATPKYICTAELEWGCSAFTGDHAVYKRPETANIRSAPSTS